MRHRGAILVAQQRWQAVGAEVLEQPALEIVRHAVVVRRLASARERGRQHPRDIDALTALAQAPANQRADDVAKQPRFASEFGIAALAQELAEQHIRIVVVSGEQLVAGLAVERDRHLAPSEPHHHPHRERRRRHHRLLHVPDPRLELADEVLVSGLHRAVVGAGHLEHAVDVGALVDAVPREHGGERTFSAVFPGDRIDESTYIDSVLKVTGADNSAVQPTDQDFIRELEAWVWHMEEPMVSSAPFAMWMVMRLARRQVTVTLDGQAGDELLAGYDHYPYVLLRQLLRERRYGEFAREAWLLRDIVSPLVRRRLRERGQRVDVAGMLSPSFTRGRKAPEDDRVADDLKRRLLQDFRTYSLPPLLRYEDRASMAHSLEARLPFLDQELVDYILTLPRSAIIHNGWTRAIVRKSLHGVLPRRVEARRKKIGFTTPEFRWYRRQRAVLQSLMRSPSFRARPYWKAAAVAENFRRACAGEVEESMFFWRAVNAEVWLRIYIDGRTRALDEHSYEGGFVRRGDRAAARKMAGGEALLEGARLNWGRHLFLEDRGRIWARFPLRSTLIKPGDDLLEVISGSLDGLRSDGVDVADGDVLLVSEKALAISQGRSYPIGEIAVTRMARVLSRYVSHEPTGVGLAHPTTMQLAIDEAGSPRILLAAVAAAVTKPLGMRGVFYRVAGHGVNAIDGPSSLNLPPYDTWATKSPLDPSGAALRIAADVRRRTERRVAVAIIDANDMAAEVFASVGVDAEAVLAMIADNPLGQSDEQTPFGLVRRVAHADVATPAPERVPVGA